MALTVDQKRLKATKFPPEFDQRVDLEKVNVDLMKKWIAGKMTSILGDEDDVVVETCYNLLEQNRYVS
jgi:serine/arginine repetitive matrix protein 1